METNLTKWEFLRPFYGTFSGVCGVQIVPARVATTLQYHLLAFQLSYGDRESISNVRDALELVLLQSLVDRNAFMEMTRTSIALISDNQAFVFVDDPETSLPCTLRVVLSIDYATQPGKLTALLSALLVPVAQDTRDALFKAARARIFDLIANEYAHHGHQADMIRQACEQLTISVDVELGGSNISRNLLQELTQLQLVRNQGKDEEDALWPYKMDQLSVRVNAQSIHETDMELLREIVSSGRLTLRNRDFVYAMNQRQPCASPVQFGKGLAALTYSSDSRKLVHAKGRAPRCFSAKVGRYDTGFHQICSSLMVAQDIESMNLELLSTNTSTASRSQYVVWLLHTLFSSSATHSIRHVSLPMVSLSDELYDGMMLYSQCANPAALLFNQKVWGPMDLARESQKQPKRVVVAKGTPLTLRPGSTRSNPSVPLEESISCDVLYESENQSVHILVPGYGHCRVPATAVVLEESPTPSLGAHPIKSLTLTGYQPAIFNNTSRFGELLALIGRPLDEISVEYFLQEATALLTVLLAASPTLQSIRLFHCQIGDFGYFVDAYRTGRCRARTLDLMVTYTPNHGSLIGFFEALGDPRTAISATVRELSVSLVRTINANESYEQPLQAVEKMLAANRTLRVLSLDVVEDAAYELFTPLRLRYHDQWVPGWSDPMTMRSKCAFLSIIGISNAAAIAQLDSCVISLIFEMAATRVKRVVAIRASISRTIRTVGPPPEMEPA